MRGDEARKGAGSCIWPDGCTSRLERLITEPCLWRFRTKVQGEMTTVGMIGSYVDDFLIVGSEANPNGARSSRSVMLRCGGLHGRLLP